MQGLKVAGAEVRHAFDETGVLTIQHFGVVTAVTMRAVADQRASSRAPRPLVILSDYTRAVVIAKPAEVLAVALAVPLQVRLVPVGIVVGPASQGLFLAHSEAMASLCINRQVFPDLASAQEWALRLAARRKWTGWRDLQRVH